MPFKLVIADDHPVTRQGLARFCKGTEFDVVALVDDAKSTLAAFETFRPDALLIDVRLGQDDGLAVLSDLMAGPIVPVVVIMSGHDNPTHIARATALGARDFVSKCANRSEFLLALTNSVKGTERSASGRMAAMKLALANRTPDTTIGPLTCRETQILVHIALGLKNKEISASLRISSDTVKEHIQNLLRKLDVRDRTAAALFAVRSGLLAGIAGPLD